MSFKVPERFRIRTHRTLGTDERAGNNGAFDIPSPKRSLWCIVSDGMGWEHVSVSVKAEPKNLPSYKEMCSIKDLFWGSEDVVVQFHPKKSQFVNFHKGCLHLWRPIDQSLPTPDSIMVGPR